MNIFRCFTYLIALTAFALPALASESDPDIKNRFNVTLHSKAITIADREIKEKLSVALPEWLQEKGASDPKIAIAPSKRFFMIYNTTHYSQYALDHELFKPGVLIVAHEINLPSTLSGLVSINIRKPTPDSAAECLCFNYKIIDKGMIELNRMVGEEPADVLSISMALTKPRYSKDVGCVSDMIEYIPKAKEGLEAAKYLATKTALHPCASFVAHCNDTSYRTVVGYQKKFSTFKELSHTTPLNQRAIERICWWIEHLKEQPHLIQPDVHHDTYVAKAVFEEAYASK